MLNPSTANADADDPTIRKCMGFARFNGFGGIVVLNLSTYRSTDPLKLISMRGHCDTVGPEADAYLKSIPTDATIVCGWGNFPEAQPSFHHRYRVVMMLLVGRPLKCVRQTKIQPWHPLYVPYGPLLDYANPYDQTSNRDSK